MERTSSQPARASEQGTTLIEVLVSILLIAIIGGAMVSNIIFSSQMSKFTEVDHAASSIAQNRMEELASMDVLDVDSSLDETDNQVSWDELPGVTFLRTTTITVNADSSRTVEVSVETQGYPIPVSASYQDRFTLW